MGRFKLVGLYLNTVGIDRLNMQNNLQWLFVAHLVLTADPTGSANCVKRP